MNIIFVLEILDETMVCSLWSIYSVWVYEGVLIPLSGRLLEASWYECLRKRKKKWHKRHGICSWVVEREREMSLKK